jgi:membrane protein implicated in regulation of membrane protease activity
MTAAMIWLVVGCALMLSEFVVPGFIIFFFGAGAVFTAAALLISPMGLPGQFTVFLLSSVVLLFVLRRLLPRIFSGYKKENTLPADEEEFAGEPATVMEDIAPGRQGKILFHGSAWTAESKEKCSAGETVRIVRRSNLTYVVEKQN